MRYRFQAIDWLDFSLIEANHLQWIALLKHLQIVEYL